MRRDSASSIDSLSTISEKVFRKDELIENLEPKLERSFQLTQEIGKLYELLKEKSQLLERRERDLDKREREMTKTVSEEAHACYEECKEKLTLKFRTEEKRLLTMQEVVEKQQRSLFLLENNEHLQLSLSNEAKQKTISEQKKELKETRTKVRRLERELDRERTKVQDLEKKLQILPTRKDERFVDNLVKFNCQLLDDYFSEFRMNFQFFVQLTLFFAKSEREEIPVPKLVHYLFVILSEVAKYVLYENLEFDNHPIHDFLFDNALSSTLKSKFNRYFQSRLEDASEEDCFVMVVYESLDENSSDENWRLLFRRRSTNNVKAAENSFLMLNILRRDFEKNRKLDYESFYLSIVSSYFFDSEEKNFEKLKNAEVKNDLVDCLGFILSFLEDISFSTKTSEFLSVSILALSKKRRTREEVKKERYGLQQLITKNFETKKPPIWILRNSLRYLDR